MAPAEPAPVHCLAVVREAERPTSVEQLCRALSSLTTDGTSDPKLVDLMASAQTEVGKLRHLADALKSELQALECDAQRARAEAADLIRKNELLRSSSTSDDAAVSALASSLKADVALLRDQLEHVTAAYVEQGNALHRARMRWRIAHTRESPETAAAVAAEVAAEEAEEQAALTRAQAALDAQQKNRQDAKRALERELESERARSLQLTRDVEALTHELARERAARRAATAQSKAAAGEAAEAEALTASWRQQARAAEERACAAEARLAAVQHGYATNTAVAAASTSTALLTSSSPASAAASSSLSSSHAVMVSHSSHSAASASSSAVASTSMCASEEPSPRHSLAAPRKAPLQWRESAPAAPAGLIEQPPPPPPSAAPDAASALSDGRSSMRSCSCRSGNVVVVVVVAQQQQQQQQRQQAASGGTPASPGTSRPLQQLAAQVSNRVSSAARHATGAPAPSREVRPRPAHRRNPELNLPPLRSVSPSLLRPRQRPSGSSFMP